MDELRLCRNTWMYCDGQCRLCTVVATTSNTTAPITAPYEVNEKEDRHGKWLDIEHAPYNLLYATCSACGKRQTIESTNFCPHCGAKMDGGVEE